MSRKLVWLVLALAGVTLLVVVLADGGDNPKLLHATPAEVALTSDGGLATAAIAVSPAAAAEMEAVADVGWLTAEASGEGIFTLIADPSGLADGSHEGRLTFSAPGHEAARIVVVLTVSRWAGLQTATSPDRGDGTALEGAVLSGEVFVFVDVSAPAAQVSFYVDDPGAAGQPMSVDDAAPFDLAGTDSSGAAVPFDTRSLGNGSHTLTAVVDWEGGTSTTVSAALTVANLAPLEFTHDQVSAFVVTGRVVEERTALQTLDGSASRFQITTTAPWLSLSASSNETPAVIDLVFDATELAPGVYETEVVAIAADGSSAELAVTLEVRPADASTTTVSLEDGRFHINGQPTNAGTAAEGLLLNARMVQAAFDDDTGIPDFAYPDTGVFDPERNLEEFLAFVPEMAARGLDAVTVGMQGGNPWPQTSNTIEHPEVVTAFAPDGSLRPDWMSRLERVIETLDEHRMVVILSLFYQHQSDELEDEEAVVAAVDNTIGWLTSLGYGNVIIEIANETGPGYAHAVMRPDRVHELVERASGHGFLVSVSHAARGSRPSDPELSVVDFVTLHSNGLTDQELERMVIEQRRRTDKPIVINEGFPVSHLGVAVGLGVSWGFHDDDRANNYRNGYQAVPVRWAINTPAKEAFFDAVAEITGS